MILQRELTVLPKVFVYPEGQRIWLVRASGGKHFQNFLKHGVVAIAHVDKLIKKHALKEIPSREVLRGYLEAESDSFFDSQLAALKKLDDTSPDLEPDVELAEEEYFESKMSLANREAQVNKFAQEMHVGDLVVTLCKSHIAIGQFTSESYIDETVLKNTIYRGAKEPKVEYLDSKLRRNVAWGKPISRELLSAGLKKPLLARNTVSSLDEYWDKIYSLIYPVFVRHDVVYFSNRVARSGPVGTRNMCRLLDFVVCTQLATDALLKPTLPGFDLAKLLEESLLGADFQERLTSQAEVMSPGYFHHAVRVLNGVRPEVYARILAALLAFGLTGCQGGSDALNSLSEEIVSTLQQEDMSQERTAKPANRDKMDKMLEEYKQIMDKKGVSSLTSSLDLKLANIDSALPSISFSPQINIQGTAESSPQLKDQLGGAVEQFRLDLE